MSIYATCWILKFPRFGDEHFDCDWVKVIGQGVPAHVGTPTAGHGYETGDPFVDFLPPAIPIPEHDHGLALRAMVVVREGTEKRGQQYIGPLLVLSGDEYDRVPFPDLHRRICDALRGERAELVAQLSKSDGKVHMMHEDGSMLVVPDANSGNDLTD